MWVLFMKFALFFLVFQSQLRKKKELIKKTQHFIKQEKIQIAFI